MSNPPISIQTPPFLNGQWIEFNRLATLKPTTPIVLDFSLTTQIDSAGIALVNLLRKEYQRHSVSLTFLKVSVSIQAILDHNGAITPLGSPAPLPVPFLDTIGTQALAFYHSTVQAITVLTEMIYWGTIGLFTRRDFRRGVLLEQMFYLGYGAVGIVALLSFLVGIVLAQQTAMQLKDYGAGIFLAQLMAFSMIREMGPLLTAIILAGRTGSATTAEIATMVVNEEIDALQTMGLNPIQFVIVPKFWAITITMPFLVVISMATGIIGGFLVSLLYLDIPASLFWNEVSKLKLLLHFVVGMSKSLAFAWIIVWLGSFYGLRVHGGAEEVGRETTNSVVACLFAIIIADAIFSFLFYNI